jgi:hypothetical protein
MKSNKDMETSNTLGEETNEEAEATGKTAKETSKDCEPEIPNSVDIKARGENESTSSDMGTEDTLTVSGGSIQARCINVFPHVIKTWC